MNKNKLAIGTRITFYPVDGAEYQAEGTILGREDKGYTVLVSSGIGSNDNRGKAWYCRPGDITSAEPKPGAWGAK